MYATVRDVNTPVARSLDVGFTSPSQCYLLPPLRFDANTVRGVQRAYGLCFEHKLRILLGELSVMGRVSQFTPVMKCPISLVYEELACS